MIDADRPAFAKLMLGMQEIYGQKLSLAGIELYWRTLQSWTIAEFEQAVVHLISDRPWLPRPADFERLRATSTGRSAEAAWQQIIENHGECDDPIGARALRVLGGWRTVGYMESSRLPWLLERFREAYGNLDESQRAQEGLLLEDNPNRFAGMLRDTVEPEAARNRTPEQVNALKRHEFLSQFTQRFKN